MPRRTDFSTILIIGAGPIIIGQACEFDYSGTQAVKALKAEGYRIVLVNSNPATIMTDPDLAASHLCRADHPRGRRQDHRQGAPCGAGRLRAAADDGRPDGAQLRALAAAHGRAQDAWRRDDRRHRRGDRQGRGSREIPRGDDQDRPRHAALAPDQDAVGRARHPRRHRPAGDHPAELHDGRHRRRHRLHQGRVHRDHRGRHRRLADQRGAGRGERARLEGIRDGGGPRQARTIASSSARSRTSTRWACTRAIPSPWRRR